MVGSGFFFFKAFLEKSPNQFYRTHVALPKCPFCDPHVLEKEAIITKDGVTLMYNIRKGCREGSRFLIFPEKHVVEIDDIENALHISAMRKAFISVLQQQHPDAEIMHFIQNGHACGQTVFHTHEQIFVIEPERAMLTAAFMLSGKRVTDEEMERITTKYRALMEEALHAPTS